MLCFAMQATLVSCATDVDVHVHVHVDDDVDAHVSCVYRSYPSCWFSLASGMSTAIVHHASCILAVVMCEMMSLAVTRSHVATSASRHVMSCHVVSCDVM